MKKGITKEELPSKDVLQSASKAAYISGVFFLLSVVASIIGWAIVMAQWQSETEEFQSRSREERQAMMDSTNSTLIQGRFRFWASLAPFNVLQVVLQDIAWFSMLMAVLILGDIFKHRFSARVMTAAVGAGCLLFIFDISNDTAQNAASQIIITSDSVTANNGGEGETEFGPIQMMDMMYRMSRYQSTYNYALCKLFIGIGMVAAGRTVMGAPNLIRAVIPTCWVRVGDIAAFFAFLAFLIASSVEAQAGNAGRDKLRYSEFFVGLASAPLYILMFVWVMWLGRILSQFAGDDFQDDVGHLRPAGVEIEMTAEGENGRA